MSFGDKLDLNEIMLSHSLNAEMKPLPKNLYQNNNIKSSPATFPLFPYVFALSASYFHLTKHELFRNQQTFQKQIKIHFRTTKFSKEQQLILFVYIFLQN